MFFWVGPVRWTLADIDRMTRTASNLGQMDNINGENYGLGYSYTQIYDIIVQTVFWTFAIFLVFWWSED